MSLVKVYYLIRLMEHIITKFMGRKLIIVSQGPSIISLAFDTQPEFKYYLNNSYQNNRSNLLTSAVNELDEYLKGKRKTFDIKFSFSGTKFQTLVWAEVSKIPYGRTLSYLDIANNILRPKAYRAVANAVGKNPISIIIPCHRVIRLNGEIGGYSGGLDIKKSLLLHEAL